MITTGILTFIFAWSEFLFANTFAFDQTTQPATVVIPNFATQFTTDYGAQAAGAIAVTVPLARLEGENSFLLGQVSGGKAQV